MNLFALLGMSVMSIFVPGVPEGTAVYFVQKLHHGVLPVAAVCAAGQGVAFGLLYLGGEELVAHWGWLARQVGRVRERHTYHLERRFLTVAVAAGLFGVPPAIAIAALSSAFGVPAKHLLPVLYGTRIVRFTVLILFGAELAAWWHQLWLHFGH